MSEPFTRAERDALLARIREIEARIWPGDAGPAPGVAQRSQMLDALYAMQGEYADRLPRVVVSACPFTGAPLMRSIDPFGLDGPWWQKDRTFTPAEPAAPPTFRVLLGALDLRGREPAEAGELVIPGPGAPFVVPRLLELPEMVAVVSRLELANGDLGYPIAYFSTEEMDPTELHQEWTRAELWYSSSDGDEGWMVMNDPWDFDLAPWIERGKLRWLRSGDESHRVIGPASGERCPFLDLPGDRLPQFVADGTRELGELPDGVPPQPFEG
jgi:hypothetical protein